MQLTKIIRTYSKSINAKNYGVPESWLKFEATYEAQIESNDDPVAVSKLLHENARQDVIASQNDAIAKMQEAAAAMKANAAFKPLPPPTGLTAAPAATVPPSSTAVATAPVSVPVATPAPVAAPDGPVQVARPPMAEAAPEPLHETLQNGNFQSNRPPQL